MSRTTLGTLSILWATGPITVKQTTGQHRTSSRTLPEETIFRKDVYDEGSPDALGFGGGKDFQGVRTRCD